MASLHIIEPFVTFLALAGAQDEMCLLSSDIIVDSSFPVLSQIPLSKPDYLNRNVLAIAFYY